MSTPARKKKKAQAFTLIEILVVIAIIGILSAILIPVISRARASAHMAADIGKLKTIGFAVSQFAADHKGRFPYTQEIVIGPNAGQSVVPAASEAGRWWEAVDRYMPPMGGFNPLSNYNYLNGLGKGGGRDVWYSKNMETPEGWAEAYAPLSFGPNNYMQAGTPWGAPNPLLMRKPSSTVLATEMNGISISSVNSKLPPTNRGDEQTGIINGYRASQPGNRALFLFCDLHVEALAGDQSEASPSRRVEWMWW